MTARRQFVDFVEKGKLAPENVEAALAVSQILPDGKAWRVFVDRLLLCLGSLALAFSVLFFVAYNWSDIGRFARFGIVEALLVLAIALYCKVDHDRPSGQVSLLVATILLGVLMALYGQTYQTGVDPWHLFFNWALLMLPWTFIARFPALWILWVALINLSITLYLEASGGLFGWRLGVETALSWLLFLFNTAALLVWELLAGNRPWLQQRWAARLLATGGGIPLTWLVLDGIFEVSDSSLLTALTWALWLALLYWAYRQLRPDLFMLAGGCLSGIVVSVSFVIEHLWDDSEAGTYLLIALLVIGLGTGAATWLRKVQQEWRS